MKKAHILPSRLFLPLHLLLILFLLLFFVDSMCCHRGGGKHGHGPPMPFLRAVNATARHDFFEIVQNGGGTKTKGEVKARLGEWARQNGVEAEYQKYVENEKLRGVQIHSTASGNLSGQALELFNKVWEINQDDGLTFLQDCQQIGQAMEDADPMVRQIVFTLLPPKPLPGPPPRGCPPFMGAGRGGGCHGGGHHHGGGGGGGGHHHGGGGGRKGGGWKRGPSTEEEGGDGEQVEEENEGRGSARDGPPSRSSQFRR